jgi:hypothetical protein
VTPMLLLLAYNLVSPYLGHEPKVKVVTIFQTSSLLTKEPHKIALVLKVLT